MNIGTRFSIGETVFIMDDRREHKVTKIEASEVEEGISLVYYIDYISSRWRRESDIYKPGEIEEMQESLV